MNTKTDDIAYELACNIRRPTDEEVSANDMDLIFDNLMMDQEYDANLPYRLRFQITDETETIYAEVFSAPFYVTNKEQSEVMQNFLIKEEESEEKSKLAIDGGKNVEQAVAATTTITTVAPATTVNAAPATNKPTTTPAPAKQAQPQQQQQQAQKKNKNKNKQANATKPQAAPVAKQQQQQQEDNIAEDETDELVKPKTPSFSQKCFEDAVVTRLEFIQESFDYVVERLDRLNKKVDNVEKRLSFIERKIDNSQKIVIK